MNRCIAIFGPTASGKSSLALRLAKEIDSVIISVDSMQIYKGMNIGTAKPNEMEQAIVPHKMIDICSPDENFSVYDFKRIAENEMHSALCCGKTPILVGGTGLYFDAIFNNTDFGEFEIDPEVRIALLQKLNENGGEALLDELKRIDPVAAVPLHAKDHKRILRALEVFYSTKKTLTQIKKESHRIKSSFEFLKFHLVFENRENLYNRINARVDQMVNDGLVDEARQVYEDNLFRNKTASQAIGYKELIPYFSNGKSLDLCLDTLKQKTRNYAKRQITWFRRYSDANEIFMDTDTDPFLTLSEMVRKFLKEDSK